MNKHFEFILKQIQYKVFIQKTKEKGNEPLSIAFRLLSDRHKPRKENIGLNELDFQLLNEFENILPLYSEEFLYYVIHEMNLHYFWGNVVIANSMIQKYQVKTTEKYDQFFVDECEYLKQSWNHWTNLEQFIDWFEYDKKTKSMFWNENDHTNQKEKENEDE